MYTHICVCVYCVYIDIYMLTSLPPTPHSGSRRPSGCRPRAQTVNTQVHARAG